MKTTIFGHTFHLYSFYYSKLSAHWLDFYLKDENLAGEKKKMKKKNNSHYHFSLDEKLTFLLFGLIGCRGLVASLLPSLYSTKYHQTLPIYFGSFYQLIGVAHPFHVEFLFVIICLNYLAIALVPRFYKRDHFRWLDILLCLSQREENEDIQVKHNKHLSLSRFEMRKLRGQARRSLYLVHAIVSVNTVRVAVSFSSIAIVSYYPNVVHLAASAIWQILYVIFVVNLSSVLYTTVTYFCLLSTVLRLKLRQINNDNTFNSVLKADHFLEQNFHLVDKLLGLARQYNAFWAHLLSSTVLLRVWIINFVLYLVLFANITSKPFRAVYSLIGLFEMITFALVTSQAAKVATEAKRSAARLRCSLYNYRLNFPSVQTKIKIQNQCHLLENGTDVGLCLSNGVLVTQNVVAHIIRECSTYFFLFTMLSLNYRLN